MAISLVSMHTVSMHSDAEPKLLHSMYEEEEDGAKKRNVMK